VQIEPDIVLWRLAPLLKECGVLDDRDSSLWADSATTRSGWPAASSQLKRVRRQQHATPLPTRHS
jgi:hypothetical protein